jgi:hypothetical protein
MCYITCDTQTYYNCQGSPDMTGAWEALTQASSVLSWCGRECQWGQVSCLPKHHCLDSLWSKISTRVHLCPPALCVLGLASYSGGGSRNSRGGGTGRHLLRFISILSHLGLTQFSPQSGLKWQLFWTSMSQIPLEEWCGTSSQTVNFLRWLYP